MWVCVVFRVVTVDVCCVQYGDCWGVCVCVCVCCVQGGDFIVCVLCSDVVTVDMCVVCSGW